MPPRLRGTSLCGIARRKCYGKITPYWKQAALWDLHTHKIQTRRSLLFVSFSLFVRKPAFHAMVWASLPWVCELISRVEMCSVRLELEPSKRRSAGLKPWTSTKVGHSPNPDIFGRHWVWNLIAHLCRLQWRQKKTWFWITTPTYFSHIYNYLLSFADPDLWPWHVSAYFCPCWSLCRNYQHLQATFLLGRYLRSPLCKMYLARLRSYSVVR